MNLIYDCEIIRMIPGKGISMTTLETGDARFKRFGDGFEYCGGWEDYKNMGISVICVADLDSEFEKSFNLNLKNDRLIEASQKIAEFITVPVPVVPGRLQARFIKDLSRLGIHYSFNGNAPEYLRDRLESLIVQRASDEVKIVDGVIKTKDGAYIV